MEEIRRPDDGELCGFISQNDVSWTPLTVFGSELAAATDRDAAAELVLVTGLAALSEHWLYRASPDSDWEIVLILEANPKSVTIALGYYSLPGVETVVLTAEQVQEQRLLQRRTN